MLRAKVVGKKYTVVLSAVEREQLLTMVSKGKHSVRELLRARILLKADESDGGDGWSDTDIAAALETSTDTAGRTHRRLVEGGFDGALKHHHAETSARTRVFDGAAEAS